MNIKTCELSIYLGKDIKIRLTKVKEGHTNSVEWWEGKTIYGKLKTVNHRDENDSTSGWIELEEKGKTMKYRFDWISFIESV